MADDADNLVLRLLREMRQIQEEHSRKLEGIRRIEQRLDDLHESTITALGFAAHANVRHENVRKELDELRERIERLEKDAATVPAS